LGFSKCNIYFQPALNKSMKRTNEESWLCCKGYLSAAAYLGR
jgi:hypothetical protein